MRDKISLLLIGIFLIFAGVVSFVIIKNPDLVDRVDLLLDFVGFLMVLSSLVLIRGRGRG